MVPESKLEDTKSTDVEQAEGEQEDATRRRKRRLACGAIAGVLVVGTIVAIVALTIWDAKDARLYEGEPLPENIGYIGRWVTDGEIAVRLNTFAIAGDRLACDFSVRNETNHSVTVAAIGRTVIAQLMEEWLSQDRIPLRLSSSDQPMAVTDDQSLLGIGSQFGLGPIKLQGQRSPEPAKPFSLEPGEVERFRYRPPAHELIMPASTLRLAVKLQNEDEPRPFYVLRRCAGIGGWFAQGAEKLVRGSS